MTNKDKIIEPIKPVQGWECPKCGSVYAIWISKCDRCENSNIRTVSTTKGTYEITG